MDKEEYLGEIKRAIDYEKMHPFPGGSEMWILRQQPGIIACLWYENYRGERYGIGLAIRFEPEGWDYQNPPEETRRVSFVNTTTHKALDSIPQPVAQHSLNALPYTPSGGLGIPTWGWVLIGGGTAVGVAVAIKTIR